MFVLLPKILLAELAILVCDLIGKAQLRKRARVAAGWQSGTGGQAPNWGLLLLPGCGLWAVAELPARPGCPGGQGLLTGPALQLVADMNWNKLVIGTSCELCLRITL